MKKIRNFKIIQLILITLFAVIGYILIFRRTSPETMHQDLIPFSVMYYVFIGALILLIAGICIDLLLLSKLEVEKQSLDKLSYLDPVTGGLNRTSTDILAKQYEADGKVANGGCFIFHITNLVEINKSAGYKEGDRLLRMFYSLLEMHVRDEGFVTRNIPDRFVVYFPDVTRAFADDFIEKVGKSVNDYNVDAFDTPIEYNSVCSLNSKEKKETISELIACTIAKLKPGSI